MSDIDRMASELGHAIRALQTDLDNLTDHFHAAEEKRRSISLKIDECERRMEASESSRRSAQTELEEDPYAQGALAILEKGSPGLRGMVGMILTFDETLAHWLEECLGRMIYALVFDRADQAELALGWLEREKRGRATCLALEQISPAIGAVTDDPISGVRHLAALAQCPPDLDKLKHYLFGRTYVSGNRLYRHGSIEGGTFSAGTGRLQLLRRVQECSSRLTKDRELHSALLIERDGLRGTAADQAEQSSLRHILEKKERILENLKRQQWELEQCIQEITPLKMKLSPSLPAPAEEERATHTEGSSAPATCKGKILVADDDSHIRVLARLHLEKAGFEVIEASDGKEAVALAGRSDFDLIVLDVVMPNLNGWETSKILKSDQRTREIPVIILTTGARPTHEALSWERGAVQFFQKPVTEALVEQVKSMISSKAA